MKAGFEHIDVSKPYQKRGIVKPILFSLLAGVVLATGALGYIYARYLSKPTTCNLSAEQVWAKDNVRQVQHARAEWEALQQKVQEEVEKNYFQKVYSK